MRDPFTGDIDLDRPAYFAAIREAIGQAYEPPHDATPFVAYFLGSIVKSADYVLARIRGLGQVMVGIRRAIVERTLLRRWSMAWPSPGSTATSGPETTFG